MAGVSVESGGGARRDANSEINMVPMIDLMMCLICFLLITAVWSTMARLETRADVPGDATAPPTTASEPMLHVTIDRDEAFVLSWRKDGAVTSTLTVPMNAVHVGEGRNAQTLYPELAAAIEREWRASGSHRDPADPRVDHAVVHSDDRAPYGQIVAVIDAVEKTRRAFPGGGTTLFPAMAVTFARAAN